MYKYINERTALYKTIGNLKNKDNVELVERDGKKYVMKSFDKYKSDTTYDRRVYDFIMDNHPSGVPAIIEFIEDDRWFIVVEEYIQGISPQKRIKKGDFFTEEEAGNIIIQLCNILKPFHQAEIPIIHRDIKPSNIVIDNGGTVYLTDFDSAKLYNDKSVEDTILLGTRDFAAPEQYGFGQSDCRTDIYGLGVTFYYLVKGKIPGKVSKDELFKFPYSHIITKATSMDSSMRYENVMEMAKEIQKTHEIQHDKKYILRKYMLPGFRSRKPWKMLLALFGYFIIIYCGCTITVEDGTLTDIITVRVYWFILTVTSCLFVFNYLDIWDRCMINRIKGIKKYLFIMLLLIIYAFLLVLLLSIVISVLPASQS